MNRRVLSKEELVKIGWEHSFGPDGELEPTCPVCRLFAAADNSTACFVCGWKPGDWPCTRADRDAFQQLVLERGCFTIGDVQKLFQKERGNHQTVIINERGCGSGAWLIGWLKTEPVASVTLTPTPKILGREFQPDGDGKWWLLIGCLYLERMSHGYWQWRIDSSAGECSSLEECLDDLRRELRFLQRELGLDIHQQTGIDAYAMHLGKQAANGVILAHETEWLEEYDRRRIHERKPSP